MLYVALSLNLDHNFVWVGGVEEFERVRGRFDMLLSISIQCKLWNVNAINGLRLCGICQAYTLELEAEVAKLKEIKQQLQKNQVR